MSEMITIGKITKHLDKDGGVRCLILSDFPERFYDLERVFLEKDDDIKRMHVEEIYFREECVVLKFKEIKSLGDAEKLKGYYIKVPIQEAVELPEGHYFLHELVGMQVFTDIGEYLGLLEDIITTGSHDIYVVYQGKKEIMLPAIHEVVKEIDVQNRKMVVHIIEGLLDL